MRLQFTCSYTTSQILCFSWTGKLTWWSILINPVLLVELGNLISLQVCVLRGSRAHRTQGMVSTLRRTLFLAAGIAATHAASEIRFMEDFIHIDRILIRRVFQWMRLGMLISRRMDLFRTASLNDREHSSPSSLYIDSMPDRASSRIVEILQSQYVC